MKILAVLALLAFATSHASTTYQFTVKETPNTDQSLAVTVGSNQLTVPSEFIRITPMILMSLAAALQGPAGQTQTVSLPITTNADGSASISFAGMPATIPAQNIAQISAVLKNIVAMITPPGQGGQTVKVHNKNHHSHEDHWD